MRIPETISLTPRPRRRRYGHMIAQIDGGLGCLAIVAIVAAILFPIFAQAREKARLTASESNLRQIGLGALMYAQDHSQHFPPTDSMDHFKAALLPYVKADQLFLEPAAGVPYVLNPDISNGDMAAFKDPASIVVARDAVPEMGRTAVLYADGHVRAVQTAQSP